MNKLKLLFNYLGFLLKSKNEHGIQSPFVFELYTQIIKDDQKYYCFDDIESIRAMLLLSKQKINVTDLGAGSKVHSSTERRIANITKFSSKPPKYGQLLFRLANRFKPSSIIEIGTSVGISTMYLAAHNSKCTVHTIEGCPNITKIAKVNFKKIGYNNIKIYNDSFENALPTIISQHETLDFVYFDGNHTKAATLSYFNKCVEKASVKSVFIFDDIYWSDEMKAAWEEIKKHPKVTTTIDVFVFGMVLFNTDLSKENFVLRY
ncbi:MAG: class I SAM-dependent methyltransferase [Vicingaceae bacterium]|nr:class I SAM-dependent methyltransferase [Vicingaceae bacterium]